MYVYKREKIRECSGERERQIEEKMGDRVLLGRDSVSVCLRDRH